MMKKREIRKILYELVKDSNEKREFFEQFIDDVREVFFAIRFFTDFAEDNSAIFEEVLETVDSVEELEEFLKEISDYEEIDEKMKIDVQESLDLIEKCADHFFCSRNYVFKVEGLIEALFSHLGSLFIFPRCEMLRVVIESNLAEISRIVDEYKDIRHSLYEELDKIEAAVESNKEKYSSLIERANALVF